MPLETNLPGVLSDADGKALFTKIRQMTTGGGDTVLTIRSRQSGSTTWARNRITLASETRTINLTIERKTLRGRASITTTQTDDAGLRTAVQQVEEAASIDQVPFVRGLPSVSNQEIAHPTLWSDATAHFSSGDRTALVNSLIAPSMAAGMLSAGKLQTTADAHMTINAEGTFRYYPVTTVDCSVTTRNATGTASGWAGTNHYALEKIDPKALAARALDKCQASVDPRAVEPGHYTVILEPQAVADLLTPMIGLPTNSMDRYAAEVMSVGPFSHGSDGSRIGERILDDRLILHSDPMDVDGGFLPYVESDGIPYRPASWVDRGILKELGYHLGYAQWKLHRKEALPCPESYRLMAAPNVQTRSVEEMIASTDRGLLVTRFYDVRCIDGGNLLCTGVTRDGLWLIQQGKITRPVKNFRFRESPLYVLNRVVNIGVPVRVFSPDRAWIVPAIQSHDFSFTSLSDAV